MRQGIDRLCHLRAAGPGGLWIGGLLVLVAAVIPAVFNTFGGQTRRFFLTRAFDGQSVGARRSGQSSPASSGEPGCTNRATGGNQPEPNGCCSSAPC